MVKQIATQRRSSAIALIVALSMAIAITGCGVKGPLVPAPKPAASAPAAPSASTATPPATTPVAPGATTAPPADSTDVPRKP